MLPKAEATCLNFAAVNMYKFVPSEMPDKLSCRMPDKMLNKKQNASDSSAVDTYFLHVFLRFVFLRCYSCTRTCTSCHIQYYPVHRAHTYLSLIEGASMNRWICQQPLANHFADMMGRIFTGFPSRIVRPVVLNEEIFTIM